MTKSDANTELNHSYTPYQIKDGESYMSDTQREHFKKMLSSLKGELMQEVDKTVSHMKQDSVNYSDINDRASQEEEFSIELRNRDRERKLIKKIDESLNRVDSEEFGYCESCGEEIGLRRLEARPTATLCIECKTLAEMREKHQAD